MWLTSFVSTEAVRLSTAPRRLARGLTSRTRSALAAIGVSIRRQSTYRAARRDLSRLGDGALHDIGLAREDIPRVAREMTVRRFARATTVAATATDPARRAGESPDTACCAGA